MGRVLGRDLSTILNDIEYSYKEIELDKEKKSKKSKIELDEFVTILKEKYQLSVQNKDNNLIINVDSKKNLKKLKKIFNI